MTAISVLAARPLLEIMKTPSDIIDDSYNYIIVIFEGIAAAVFFNLFSSILRSLGDSKTPLVFLIIASIINIILDFVFILTFKMGVAGAAIATVTGQICAAILAITFNLTKNPDVHISFKGFKPQIIFVKNILSVGIPSIIMSSVGSAMTFGMNKILITFSSTAVAVFGVYFKLNSFVFMPVFGLNNGMVPIVSYNYGAQNKKRLTKTIKLAIMYAVCIMFIGIMLFQFMPDVLLKLFDASDHMLEIGIPALRVISLSFAFAGICIVISSSLQALGHGFLR